MPRYGNGHLHIESNRIESNGGHIICKMEKEEKKKSPAGEGSPRKYRLRLC